VTCNINNGFYLGNCFEPTNTAISVGTGENLTLMQLLEICILNSYTDWHHLTNRTLHLRASQSSIATLSASQAEGQVWVNL